MAKSSVATPSRSINPVQHFSYLIEAALRDSYNQPKDFHENYRVQFATLIGLSFTAVLAKGDRSKSFQSHFYTFLGYGANCTQDWDNFEHISITAAEIICSAVNPFKCLGMPRYFDDFMLAMTDVICPTNVELMRKRRQIAEILKILFETCG